MEHKIGLYTDDVLLLLSDPLRSLSAVTHTIKEFSKISLHKVNATKSQMLGIHVPPDLRTHITKCTVFSWAPSDCVPYLGIKGYLSLWIK